MTAATPSEPDGAMPDDDDAALSWAGDADRGRDGPRPPRRATSEAVVRDESPQTATPGLLLVTYGILAGVYGVFTIGWVTSVLRSTTTLGSLPAEILYQLGEFLAIALPALWFVAVLWLVQRPTRRLLWLALGVVVVLPWPWVLGQ